MKVAVTGSTGFIGNHVVTLLLKQNIKVVATGTNIQKAEKISWFNDVDFIELDLNKELEEKKINKISSCDVLIHLAWSGLPNYKELFHFEKNLYTQYNFLKSVIEKGLKEVAITGTCFEYGMKEGALHTGMLADPQNSYALAKDSLRKFLQQLQLKSDFKMKWLRLFYMYGAGQSEKSILSQLEKALQNGDNHFNMSAGEQLRDYLAVEDVAKFIVEAALNKNKNGIYNICSGIPISIKKLVENYLKENNKNINLNLGFYPYTDFEPMAFWGEK